MSKRTEVEIKKMAENNAEVLTEDIENDVAETQSEVINMQKELRGYRLMPRDRMTQMRISSRVSGIKERLEFLEDLEAILEYRKKIK